MANSESGQADKIFSSLKKEMSLCEANPNACFGYAFRSLLIIWPMSIQNERKISFLHLEY